MTEVFLKLLNMSISASWLVFAVILLRLLLKKTPKWITCLLWGIVALRLAVPVSFESAFSLIPSPEVIPVDIALTQTPAIYSGIPVVNSAINPLFTLHFPAGGNELKPILQVAAMVWLAGVAVMLLYSAVTYLRLYRQVRISLHYRDNIYACDNVDSPFLLGILRPRIYIPSGIEEESLQFVLAHENAHIKRRDHWWKPLGFLFLSVYWFNPLLWVAYVLLCRDVEWACDEKVIAGMGPAEKAGYSAALAACSVHRRAVMVCPVAFGEVGVKARIKGVLNYKKPAFWIVFASVAMCAVTALCFLTNPKACDHDYQAQVTTEATCTETGIQTRLCTHCQHSYTVSVDKLAHTYGAGVVMEAPSCTHTGSMLLECIHCGDQKTQPMEMTDHIAGGPMRIKEPNCTQTGECTATCTRCHSVFVVEIYQPNDDHDLKESVLREATCAHPGEGVYTCTRCDYSESCSYAQLEHQYTKSVAVVATCLKNGADRYTCDGCGYSYLVETPLGAHNYIKTMEREATCWTDGVEVYTCTVCAAFYEVTIPKRSHVWEPWGSNYIVCTYCGLRKSSEEYSLFSNNSDDEDSLFPEIRIWP